VVISASVGCGLDRDTVNNRVPVRGRTDVIEPTRTRAGRRTRADAAWARVVTAASAADHQKTYAPNVPLRGVIGFAATTDVGALLASAAYDAPFVLLAYRSAYGAAIDPSEVVAPRFVPTLEQDAGSFCANRAQ